jgi:preprotein translocase subunit SecD
MKTILKSIIAIIISGIILTGCTNNTDPKNTILIQSVENNVSSAQLSKSAEIITNRLKDFSPEKFEMTTILDKNQIQIVFADAWDLKTAEILLVQKGALAFYETYNSKSLSGLLNGDNHLFSLFNNSHPDDSVVEIGCASVKEVVKINDYINTLGLGQKCKFAWSQSFDKPDVCLYALKLNGEKGAIISETEIESVKCGQDKASKNNEIDIRLKEPAVKKWADATASNMNKAIAIVLDDNVLSAPIVRSVINGGHCTITGDFSQSQAAYIAALGNNGELPISFKIVK